MPDKPISPVRLSPFASLVGLKPVADGTSKCTLDINHAHLNVNGSVHGGVLSTLADVSMGWEIFAHLTEKQSVATLEMKINYLVPVSSGTLMGEASLLHRSKRLIVVESRITCADVLVTKATGTFYVVPASEARQGPPRD